jgi:outer membrane protein TolC
MYARRTCACLLAALLAGTALAAPTPGVALDKAAYEKLQALLKDRRDTLREVVKARQAQYEAGRVSPGELLDARRALLHAELNLATVPGRAALNDALGKQIKEQEEIARAMRKAGRIVAGDYYSACADCRAEEARLLRERAGPRPTEAQLATLHKLRRERLDLARQALEGQETNFDVGRATLDVISKAARRALEAELDLAEKAAERIAAYRTYAAGAERQAQVTQKLFDIGRVRSRDHDYALAEKLGAEIGLLRAGGKLTPEEAGRLKALLRDRRKHSARAVNAVMSELRAGVAPFNVVVELSARLAEAELDLGEGAAGRVAAHRDHLKRLREVEEIAKAWHDAGRLTSPDYLSVKAARLAAEIAFLRAGGKPAELGN